MRHADEWDDEGFEELLREELMPEEAVPLDLNARVDEALAARASELKNMNWSVTAWVSLAAGVVMFANGAAALTFAAAIAPITIAVLYGVAVRSLVARSA
jgi:hypothetical protein